MTSLRVCVLGERECWSSLVSKAPEQGHSLVTSLTLMSTSMALSVHIDALRIVSSTYGLRGWGWGRSQSLAVMGQPYLAEHLAHSPTWATARAFPCPLALLGSTVQTIREDLFSCIRTDRARATRKQGSSKIELFFQIVHSWFVSGWVFFVVDFFFPFLESQAHLI